VTANDAIAQLAAEIRKNSYHQPAEVKKVAKILAADLRADLPGIPDDVIGAVVLRASVFVNGAARSGLTLVGAANLLGMAGQRLYHHAGPCDEPAAVNGEQHPAAATVASLLPEARQAARERIAAQAVVRAIRDGTMRSQTCATKPLDEHGTCVGITQVKPGGNEWERLGCLCECHDTADSETGAADA